METLWEIQVKETFWEWETLLETSLETPGNGKIHVKATTWRKGNHSGKYR
jgi:hypothetical protein